MQNAILYDRTEFDMLILINITNYGIYVIAYTGQILLTKHEELSLLYHIILLHFYILTFSIFEFLLFLFYDGLFL